MHTFSYRIMITCNGSGHHCVSVCRDTYRRGQKVASDLVSSTNVAPDDLWLALHRAAVEVYGSVTGPAPTSTRDARSEAGPRPAGDARTMRDGAVQHAIPNL